MKTPLISVIIPVYNTEHYLERCLTSIAHQSYKNLEIICVNDGSTDRSLDLLQKFSSIDRRILVVDKNNEGVCSARNEGLRHSQGEYISFFDSDDWCHPDYFLTMMQFQEKTDADIVTVDFYETHGEDPLNKACDETDITYTQFDRQSAIQNNYVLSYVWGRIFRSSIVKNHLFINELVPREDTAYNFKIVSEANDLKVACVHRKLYFYFQREGSLVRTGPLENTRNLAVWYIDRSKSCKDPVCKAVAIERAYKTALAYRYYQRFNPDKPAVRNRCTELFRLARNPLFGCNRIFLLRKIMYVLMEFCPALYRSYRIRNDRTLLQWEAQEKAKI